MKLPEKTIYSDTANEVTELAIIVSNLNTATNYMNLSKSVADLTPDKTTQNDISSALVKNAALLLISCFEENIGTYWLDKSFFDKTQAEKFKIVKNLRDKWIAHKFGVIHLSEISISIDPTTSDMLGFAVITGQPAN